MKISYNHILKNIESNPDIQEISSKLFQLGHEHEVQDNIFDIEVPIPLSVDKYLASIYGDNWEIPDPAWQSSSYFNVKT